MKLVVSRAAAPSPELSTRLIRLPRFPAEEGPPVLPACASWSYHSAARPMWCDLRMIGSGRRLSSCASGTDAKREADLGMAQMSEKFKAMGEQVYVDAEKVKGSNRVL